MPSLTAVLVILTSIVGAALGRYLLNALSVYSQAIKSSKTKMHGLLQPIAADQRIHWQPADRSPALSDTDLHLWHIDTQRSITAAPGDIALLSDREHNRAQRLVHEDLRNAYIRVHAQTRRILSLYLEIGPAEIAFSYSTTGKPALELNPNQIEFNLTTITDLALLAVARGQPLGIDCEQIRQQGQLMGIAQRMFPAAHTEALTRLSGKERLQAFYTSWTALEAEVKVDGRGLAGREQTSRLSVEIRHFIPAEGLIAAVARHRLPPEEQWQTLILAHPDYGLN